LLSGAALVGCSDAEGTQSRSAGPPTLSIASRPAAPTEPALDAPELRLRLPAGMRFPVLKTVRQTVVQHGTAAGDSIAGLSELEMLMSVAVEEVAPDGQTRLWVRFERITYRQDAAGQRFEFDSRRPATDLPLEAAVYAAMAGDGFAFRVGADNRIAERIDFDPFLERCLASVPADERDRVTSRIAESSGDESVANFVDDSIGLLPLRPNHGSIAAAGDSWRRERSIVRPVRLFIVENCTLVRLDDTAAQIDVNGSIAASETFDRADEFDGSAQVRVVGGHSIGHCRADRATGLPLDSRLERLIKLRVRQADGREFDQVKRIETTIRAFPRQPAASGS
jgi:hypothetical protein